MQDKTFIEQAIEQTGQIRMTDTDGANGSHTGSNEEYQSHSDDLSSSTTSYGDRSTDRLGASDKNYEDTYHQGGHNSGTTNELRN